MPLTYLDQNGLIELGVQARQVEFRAKWTLRSRMGH